MERVVKLLAIQTDVVRKLNKMQTMGLINDYNVSVWCSTWDKHITGNTLKVTVDLGLAHYITLNICDIIPYEDDVKEFMGELDNVIKEELEKLEGQHKRYTELQSMFREIM